MKTYALSLTSAFTTPSMLKARIQMLFQRRSCQVASTKFLLALPIVLLCLMVSAFSQKAGKFSHPDIPSEYKHHKSFLIEAGKHEQLSFELKKGYLYAFHVVAMEGEFLPNQIVNYGSINEQSKWKFDIGVLDKTSENRRKLEPNTFICQESGKHIIEFITEQCTQNVYLHIYEADYTQATEKTIYTLTTSNALHPLMYDKVYLEERLQYPKKAQKANITGTVELSCIVNIDGSVSELKVTKSLGYGCDEEAKRLVNQAQNWHIAYIQERDANFKRIERHVRQRITIKIPFNR